MMAGRSYLFGRLFFQVSKWTNPRAKTILEERKMPPVDERFALRVEMKTRPFFISTVATVISIILFGLAIRWAEMYYFWLSYINKSFFISTYMHQSKLDWQSVWNGLWCTLITMATVGYGDFSAQTDFGRVISVGASLAGQFLFSTMVVSLSNTAEFSRYELRVKLYYSSTTKF